MSEDASAAEGTGQRPTDVPARLSSEEQPRDSHADAERRISTILESIADPFVAYDREWRFTYINQRARELFQATGRVDDLIGRNLWETFPEILGSPFEEGLRRAVDTRAPVEFEAFYPQFGRWNEVRVYPSADGVAVYWRDVTRRKRAEEALRESEERYRAFIRNSSEGIWRFEADRSIPVDTHEDEQIDAMYRFAYLAECNEAMARMYGHQSAAELRGARLGDLLVRSDPHNTEYLRAFIRSGYRLEDAESHEVGSDGSIKYFLNNLIGIVEDGKLLRAWGTQRDITDRKRAEEALRESHELVRGIMDATADAIFVKDVDGRYLTGNKELARLFGVPLDDILGKTDADFFPPAVARQLRENDQRVLASGTTEQIEERVSLGGQPRTYLSTKSVYRNANNEVAGIVGVATDITGRKRVEESQAFVAEASALLASSLDYDATLASIARLAVPRLADWCAVDIVGGDGTTRRLAMAHQDPDRVEWARELERRYPRDPNSPTGVPNVLRTGRPEFYPEVTDELLVAAARDDEHLAMLRRIGFRSVMIVPLTARDRILGAITFVTAESGRRYDEADLALAEDLGHRAAMAIENAQLFAEVQRAREELESQAEELEEATAELAAANEQLSARTMEAEAASRAKSDFLATMSHELRTPLNAIGGYAELLEIGVRGPITAAQREDLHRIRLSQKRLLGLINDVLNFARLDAGDVQFTIADVPVDEVLSRAIHLVELQIHEKGLTHEYRSGDPAITARIDAERLQQVILNLLSNAVKFTPRGGRIVVEWSAAAGEVRILVRDTGPGIPADKFEAIFEPFVQLDRSLRSAGEGTGLGLAISRDLARAMGGDITVSSVLGEGSTFTLMVPRGADRAVAG